MSVRRPIASKRGCQAGGGEFVIRGFVAADDDNDVADVLLVRGKPARKESAFWRCM